MNRTLTWKLLVIGVVTGVILIALAMVNGGRNRMGQTLYVSMPGGDIPVLVSAPVFYDKEGGRLNG